MALVAACGTGVAAAEEGPGRRMARDAAAPGPGSALPAPAAALPPPPDTTTDAAWAALEARNIGPAGMSGRVAAVDVVLRDPSIIYVGAATGGVFRSEDGGVSWTPVFDDERVLGIGAVAVHQANPDVVWVGTGEGNPRNSAGVGYGVWKSVDGGRSWEHLGLEDSERIHRIVPHPEDEEVAYVAAMGPAWSDGEERGVYRTTDGGGSWERVLWANPRTGAADLVMDPSNPRRLLAALWEFRREPWFFTSGGPGSGLWLTEDGGDTWEEITAEDGLPEGELGRIGLAFAHSAPETVYALVEAGRSALVRSDDGGRSWRTVTDRRGIVPRPFYYADLRVDPKNENRIYSLHGTAQVSEDGGLTFRTVVPSAILHGDVHELWIDPADPRHMIMGNDGGIGITRDRGEHWRFVENLTLAQFYRIAVDDARPFNVYGGLQDNGSWFGPSTVWENKGVLNAHWTRVGGGDGFTAVPDWSDHRYGYSMSQGGNLQRFDKVTGERVPIRPVAPGPDGPALRFNWNAGFAQDPHDSTTIYLGSQFLHRSRDQGASWEVVSPDLTTNDPAKQREDTGGLTLDATGAETHTTIVDVSPSPLEPGVIWVGTDDGRVQLTRDGGATWTSVEGAIQGVPAGTWVPDVEPSRHDPATAYVVFDDHRRGNWETYLYRTRDWGESWERLPAADVFGFAHDVAEDPGTPGLLFLGTEFGVNVSVDGGATWRLWTSNGLPPAPVRELLVHPRDGDLVVGTHGRGAWIVDDVTPLRALAAEPGIADAGVHLFAPPPAYLHEVAEAIGYRSTGHAMWQGETRPYGALLTYRVAEAREGRPVALTVRDAHGRTVATLDGPAARGLNRVVWDLRAGDDPPAPYAAGAPVLPGGYEVEVALAGTTSRAALEVREDPRRPVTVDDRRAKLAALAVLDGYLDALDAARDRLGTGLAGVEDALEGLEREAGPGAGELRTRAAAARDSLRAVRERLFTGPDCQGICPGEVPADRVRMPRFRLAGSPRAPTPLERRMIGHARSALVTVIDEVNRVWSAEIEPLRRALSDAGFNPIADHPPLEIPPPGGSGVEHDR